MMIHDLILCAPYLEKKIEVGEGKGINRPRNPRNVHTKNRYNLLYYMYRSGFDINSVWTISPYGVRRNCHKWWNNHFKFGLEKAGTPNKMESLYRPVIPWGVWSLAWRVDGIFRRGAVVNHSVETEDHRLHGKLRFLGAPYEEHLQMEKFVCRKER